MEPNKTEQARRDPVLDKAITAAGGPASLARFISSFPGQKPISAQAICDWKRCPPARVIAVEAAQDKVDRHELRPDLYPEKAAA